MSDISKPIQRSNIKIEESWKTLLQEEFNADYFHRLIQFVKNENNEQTIYPPGSKIFSAFDHTPVEKVKVVIIGQDPYHGPKQANGLCFSVSEGIKPPPSLRNMFKELAEDVGFVPTGNGDLESWANQGVLLINATLTVRAGQAGSHQKQGWEQFTDAVIKSISRNGLVLFFFFGGGLPKTRNR